MARNGHGQSAHPVPFTGTAPCGTREHSALRPLSGHAILRPYHGEQAGRVITPFLDQYPQAGTCIASAADGIEVGDLIALAVESSDVAHTYTKVLAVTLLDVGWKEPQEVLVPMESEPLFRETMQKWERDGEEKRIVVKDLSGGGWAFSTSDVLTWDERDTTSPAFSLLYPGNVRFIYWKGELLYLIHERDALCQVTVKE